jgi:hypothetical protein
LQLPVPAIILTLSLSKGKDPENLDSPPSSVLFNHGRPRQCLLSHHYKTVISTEAAHAFVSSAAEKSTSPVRLLHETIHSIVITATLVFLCVFSPKTAVSARRAIAQITEIPAKQEFQ